MGLKSWTNKLLLIPLVISLNASLASVAPASIIVWQDEGAQKIFSANSDGSNRKTIANFTAGGTGLDVDFVNGKVYWTATVGVKAIYRADLDGSNFEALITTGLGTVEGITVDNLNGKIYWADQGVNKISRANLNGSDREVLLTAGLEHPHDLGLDVAAGKMYWTDSKTNKIQRANLDGSDLEDLISLGDIPGTPSPRGLAVDPEGKKIYWANQGEGKIQRANLDGSDIETLVSVSGWNGPDGIAINKKEGKLYWTGLNEVLKIQRANLDGSNIEDIVTSDLVIPRHMAAGTVVPEPQTMFIWLIIAAIGLWTGSRSTIASLKRR